MKGNCLRCNNFGKLHQVWRGMSEYRFKVDSVVCVHCYERLTDLYGKDDVYKFLVAIKEQVKNTFDENAESFINKPDEKVS